MRVDPLPPKQSSTMPERLETSFIASAIMATGLTVGHYHRCRAAHGCSLSYPAAFAPAVACGARRSSIHDAELEAIEVCSPFKRATETRLPGWRGRIRSAPGDRQGVGGASPLR